MVPDDVVLEITTAYEQGFGHANRPELSNPYAPGTPGAKGWDIGREEGEKRQPGLKVDRGNLGENGVPNCPGKRPRGFELTGKCERGCRNLEYGCKARQESK